MALFKIFKGLAKDLPSTHTEGYCYFTTDDSKFYIDIYSKESSETRVEGREYFTYDSTTKVYTKVNNIITEIGESWDSSEEDKYFYANKVALNARIADYAARAYNDKNGIDIAENYGLFEMNTTSYWNTKTTLIPPRGKIIVYSDYQTILEDNEVIDVPGIKIADGTNLLSDQPFITAAIEEDLLNHINDTVGHITSEERIKWNNKVSASTDGEILLLIKG